MKLPKHSDINLDDWRHYLNNLKITTNSRWLSNMNDNPIFGHFLIPKRDNIPKPDGNHHGVWIGEIPFQMIHRFTKNKDIIWSPFGGSGIDYEIAKKLGRECIINDITPKKNYIQKGDSLNFNPGKKIDMVLNHPPYWDIVKYSNKKEDGSNKPTLLDFLKWFKGIINNVNKYLKDGGYMILVCGNIYKNSEEIELGEMLKNICLFNGYILKQHIIKDYGETKGKEGKNYNVNYYRQLKGGYGNFYGDNIFVLKKIKSKNKIKDLYKSILK